MVCLLCWSDEAKKEEGNISVLTEASRVRVPGVWALAGPGS
jgi:hypothetical protein